jgi:hypothetical protein
VNPRDIGDINACGIAAIWAWRSCHLFFYSIFNRFACFGVCLFVLNFLNEYMDSKRETGRGIL